MEVRFKKLVSEAVLPSYSKIGDAGLDLTAISRDTENTEFVEYGTGLAVEIPEGFVGLIFPRSSVSKKDLVQANSVGVIDSGYRGEIKIRFKRVFGQAFHQSNSHLSFYNIVSFNDKIRIFDVNERVAQLMIVPYPTIQVVESDTLSETERGEGGFGHTGK